jgi:hypothetical protein
MEWLSGDPTAPHRVDALCRNIEPQTSDESIIESKIHELLDSGWKYPDEDQYANLILPPKPIDLVNFSINQEMADQW